VQHVLGTLALAQGMVVIAALLTPDGDGQSEEGQVARWQAPSSPIALAPKVGPADLVSSGSASGPRTERGAEPGPADAARAVGGDGWQPYETGQVIRADGSDGSAGSSVADAAGGDQDLRRGRRSVEDADRERTGGAASDAASDLGDQSQVVADAASADAGEETDEGAFPVGTGLVGRYYDHGTELRRIPRLGGISPTLSRLDPVVDFGDNDSFGLPFRPDTFAVEWRGYVQAREAGVYTFQLGSDDGSQLELDNVVVIDNEGLHGHREVDVRVELSPGLHVLRLTYFENYGGASCRLRYAPPGQELQVVPAHDLFPPDSEAASEHPQVESVEPDWAPPGALVALHGRGFSDIPSYNQVMLGEAPAFVVEASPDRLLIQVPEGTDGGPLVVTVGDQVSPAVPFTVEGVFGLHARYLDVDEELAALAPPPGIGAPTVERIDPQLAFGSDAAFGLPFAPQTFHAEWRGDLFVHHGGEHTFWLTCDDGGRLTIDGWPVIEHDGLHAATERSGTVFLAPGRHQILVELFQNQGQTVLQLDFQEPTGTGELSARRPIPPGRLEPPEAVRLQTPPRITAVDPPAAGTGQQVQILGEGLYSSLGPPVVTFAGVPAPILAQGSGSLLVVVPDGADSGALVVRTGPLESDPVSFLVEGYGISASYYDLEERLEAIPDLDGLTPTLVRLDEQIDFSEDAAFDLPFEPDTFAVRWEGFYLAPSPGKYTFTLGSDDGSRLQVFGTTYLEDEGLHGYRERSVEVELLDGPVPLRVEFFDNGGRASARLFVTPPGGERRVMDRLSLKPR
jgi:PA14 domain/IPT/TIG domain